MSIKIDRSYQPRPWLCGHCKQQILGYILRDVNRVRSLYVLDQTPSIYEYVGYTIGLTADDIFEGKKMENELYIVKGLDSGSVHCPACGAWNEWSVSAEALKKLIRHLKGDAGVEKFEQLTNEKR